MATKPYDYVIVGAGSAGCTLARRLTEDRQAQRGAVGLFGRGCEDRTEDCEIGALRFRLLHFVDRVAGDADEEAGGRDSAQSQRREGMRGQVHTVRAGRQRDIDALIDEYLRSLGRRESDGLAG